MFTGIGIACCASLFLGCILLAVTIAYEVCERAPHHRHRYDAGFAAVLFGISVAFILFFLVGALGGPGKDEMERAKITGREPSGPYFFQKRFRDV